MDSFIAKQPIFDRAEKVYAYELLFRSGLENVCRETDLDHAAAKVIADSLHLMGIETLTGGKKAFINVTRDALLKEYMRVLPHSTTVVEILETVEPDPEVVLACERLKHAGYMLALDDFLDLPGREPLLRIADVVKVDLIQTSPEERKALTERLGARGILMLAEKVETREAFEQTRSEGFTYFQGYFFARPSIVAARDVPGYKAHFFRILQEIHRRDMDFRRIEGIIKQDMSLCYKFLRFINSAWFGWWETIRSIRHALALLGEREVRKWVTLVAMASMGKDKPEELMVHAVTRARFCESLAPYARLGHRSEDLFLMGMFSLLDAVLDRPLAELLAELPVDDDVGSALLGRASPLLGVYEAALAYEAGRWSEFSERAAAAGIEEPAVPAVYVDAVRWAQQSFRDEPLAV